MKLILSRKGFDSSAGGVPSPILEDGGMIPLPIPSETSPIRYDQVSARGRSLGDVVRDLTGGRIDGKAGAHLDPDLDPLAYPRADGWSPIFGRCDAAEGVLRSHAVGAGDLFLFFGWFRRAETKEGGLRYVPGAEDLHVLFGWLQAGQVVRIGEDVVPEWAAYHPHLDGAARTSNTLYLATERLSLDGEEQAEAGGGLFGEYRPALRLTAPGATRGVWRLPDWFFPRRGRPPLSSHESPLRWFRREGQSYLESVPRGLEFVLDLDRYPEATAWLRSLVSGETTR